MATVDALDGEIRAIHDQIASLRAQRTNLTSVLLSAPHLATRLDQRPVQHERFHRHAVKVVEQQATRNLENAYRACAGVSAYRVKDPDPNAVDNGNILGVRIEVFVEAKFVDTYHVLLNRPSARHKTMLKIHRHTIPPCIPVRQLVAKYLPLSQRDASKPTEQDLVKFGRVLRRELVAWHLRTAAVERLRVAAGLQVRGDEAPAYGTVLNASEGEKKKQLTGMAPNAFVSDDEGDEDFDGPEDTTARNGPTRITEIEADLAARQIQVSWSNGQTAVVEVTKDGEVTRGVVRTSKGERLPDLETKLAGRIERLLDILPA